MAHLLGNRVGGNTVLRASEAGIRLLGAIPPGHGCTVADNVLLVDGTGIEVSASGCTVAGNEVSLTPSEFDLLAKLMAQPGRVFSRLDLLEELQGIALEGSERTINVHIRNLRTKIEPDPTTPRYIETVFGIGYRFCAA